MRTLCTLSVVLLSAGAVFAVRPATWNHTTEADFSKGRFKSTVKTSLGEVTLAREIKVVMPAETAPAVVSAIAVDGKNVYAADGTEGRIYRIAGKKTTKFAEPPGAMVASLLWTGKELLAGTGGSKAGIYRIDREGNVAAVWTDPKVKYVWAIVPGPKGVLYAATGPEGAVYRIDANRKGQAIYKVGKAAKNILCLIRGQDGLLYAGTDQSGLVVEIDPRKKSSRILLDAAEKEIASLLLDEQGGLYAATSDASKAKADGAGAPSGTKAGRAAPPTRPTPSSRRGAAGSAKPKPSPPGAAKKAAGKNPSPTTRPAAASAPVRARAVPLPVTRRAAPPGTVVRTVSAGPPRPGTPARPTRPPSAKAVGNAVYYIRPDGLVETVFRRPVTILAMLRQGDRLVLGTGNGGDIYTATLDGDETAQIADTDAKQVTSLAAGPGGEIYFGTANKGSVGLVGSGYAKEGTFISEALDARQIAKWGTVSVRASVPAGTKLSIATRSGNVQKPEDETWSDWSGETPVDGDFIKIGSRAGRCLQYRLTLTSADKAVPVVRQVQIIHQVGNLAPSVGAVAVQASPKGAQRSAPAVGPRVYRHVAIQAADPNGDAIVYTIAFRMVGSEDWIQIADKLPQPKYIWDTRTVGDGAYELRVTASDSPANPPASALEGARISEPVVVDNTAPVVKDFGAKVEGAKVSAGGSATDAGSRIVAMHYAVDSAKEWVAVLSKDGICDSKSEQFAFEIEDLDPGAHRIAVRVKDLYDNLGYAAVTVTAAKQE